VGPWQVQVSVAPANIVTAQVSVGATATQIVAARTGAPGTGRANITLTNTGTATVFIGNSAAVTTATGAALVAGASLTLSTTAAIFGISTATETVSALETF
jgi:hypothetical protein